MNIFYLLLDVAYYIITVITTIPAVVVCHCHQI